MERKRPKPDVARRFLKELQDTLHEVRAKRRLRPLAIVWPSGLDRSVSRSLPLTTRTMNRLLSSGFMSGDDRITARELFVVNGFGHRSLKDLLFTLEAFLHDCERNPRHERSSGSVSTSTGKESEGKSGDRWTESKNTSTVQVTAVDRGNAVWEKIEKVLKPIFAVAAETRIAEHLADALSPQCIEIASHLGATDEIETIGLGAAANGEPGPASVVARRLECVMSTMPERDLIIVEGRLLRQRPSTLETLGSELRVTRERVRQLQVKINSKIQRALGKELKLLATILSKRFDHVVTQSTMDERVSAVFPDAQGLIGEIIGHHLVVEMGYTLDGHVYLDNCAKKQIKDIRAIARSKADDAGLVEVQELLDQLPSAEWRVHWAWLLKQCNLHEMYGCLAIRNSAKARVKAALVSIGRPATRREIGEVCGFSEKEVGAHFSNIGSVIRADKDRWGIREWIDDEYDGIVGEIIQRIREDGGVTTTNRLLSEIPSKFDVSPSSVRAYMQTSMFEISDGHIRIANASMLQLRPLDDVIHGRGNNGEPYWTFVAEKRHLKGYSAVGVPPEFMKALGCEPNKSLMVRIENVMSSRGLSVRWPLASTTGGSIGYLSHPLQAVGIQPGDWVRVTLKAAGLVVLEKDCRKTGQLPESGADEILARIKDRRRAL